MDSHNTWHCSSQSFLSPSTIWSPEVGPVGAENVGPCGILSAGAPPGRGPNLWMTARHPRALLRRSGLACRKTIWISTGQWMSMGQTSIFSNVVGSIRFALPQFHRKRVGEKEENTLGLLWKPCGVTVLLKFAKLLWEGSQSTGDHGNPC